MDSKQGQGVRSVEARLERIEGMLERLLAPARDVPPIAATAVDTADELVAGLDARGIDVDERVRRALGLLERLTAPATVAALERLLALVEAAPDLVAAVTDTLDGAIARAQDAGIDVDGRMRATGRLLERMTRPAVLETTAEVLARIDALGDLARSDLLDRETIDTLGLIARAIRDATHAEVRDVGLIGSLAAIRDPRVKPAVGFAVSIAERFGEALRRRNDAQAVRGNGRDTAARLGEGNGNGREAP